MTTHPIDPNPYVFLIGCIRSGTTLLQRMVDAHPDIAVIHETHWIRRFYKQRIGLTAEGWVTPELIDRICAHERFSNLGMERGDLESLLRTGEPVSYAGFVSRIFDLYACARGKRLAGDKTPAYVKSIAPLHTLWPQARFVHLVRDGRDVCLSIMNWKKASIHAGSLATWAEDPITTTALYWRRKVLLGLEGRTLLNPELYHEINYESLVADPAQDCARLCAFLGLPYHETMIRFHEGRTSTEPGLDAKHAWLPVTVGLRDWCTQMPPEDIERFEAAAGDLLEELGYPRAVPCPRPEIRAHVDRIRYRFTQEARQRGDRLPARW